VDSGWPREPHIRWGPDPPGKGAIAGGCSPPLKIHCDSESAENGYINYTICEDEELDQIPQPIQLDAGSEPGPHDTSPDHLPPDEET